jgi:hypothetical protein
MGITVPIVPSVAAILWPLISERVSSMKNLLCFMNADNYVWLRW